MYHSAITPTYGYVNWKSNIYWFLNTVCAKY